MSDTAISRFTTSRPLTLRTFRVRLFLLTLVSLKLPEVFRLTSRCRGVVVLGSLPRSLSGHSILMISAPRAPSHRVAHGPARTQLKSTTRMFRRACGPDMKLCQIRRGQRAIERIDDAVTFRPRDDQRRRQGDGVAVPATATAATDDDTVLPAKVDNTGDLRRTDRFLRHPVPDQFKAQEKTLAAGVADDVVAGEGRGAGKQKNGHR